MNLLRDVGIRVRNLLKVDEGGAELLSRMRERAHEFLRAGGRWSWSDWEGMSDLEREAAADAGDLLWAERVEALLCGQETEEQFVRQSLEDLADRLQAEAKP